MENKRSFIEKLIIVIAWLVLVGGILFGFLVSKGIFESNVEMSFPKAIVTFVGTTFVCITIWAVLLEVIKLSDRIRNIEHRMTKNDK